MAAWKLVVYVQSTSPGCDAVLFPTDAYTSLARAQAAADIIKQSRTLTSNISVDVEVFQPLP